MAQRFRLTGPYQPPVPLVFTLRERHIEVVYPAPPRLSLSISSSWSAARATGAPVAGGFADVPAVEHRARSGYQQAVAYDAPAVEAWTQSGPLDVLQCDAWSQALQRSGRPGGDRWAAVPERDMAGGDRWQHARPNDASTLQLVWQVAAIADARPVRARHRDTDRFGNEWRYEEALPPYRPGTQPLRFRFNGVRYLPKRVPPVYFQLGRSLRARPTQPRDQRLTLLHGSSTPQDASRTMPWSWATPTDAIPLGITYPDYDGPVIIIEPPVEPDILETYMIANSVSVVVLPERTPLDVTDIKLSLDVDSFAWRFSAAVFGVPSMNLIRPGNLTGPKTIEITINGWQWLIQVERYTRAATFPAERFSVTGSSRTTLLAAPAAPLRSAVNATAINALQAAEDQLYLTGFTLNWDATGIGPPDWSISAGALSYQAQTPMQVIARIAEAVGGIIRPARAADSLTILPRYREAVWHWGQAVVDRIIPAEVITGSSGIDGDWMPQPAWNSVYVSGTNHGVAVDVRRSGTAGDNPAPDVLDDLITGTDAARSRGICELSKGGNQSVERLTIPLFPVGGSAPGLIEPGHLCEVREVETWRGLCLGVEIGAAGVGASRVSQTLQLERHFAGGA